MAGDTDRRSATGPRRRTMLKVGLGGAALLAGFGGLFSWRWFARGYARQLGAAEIPVELSIKEFAIVKSLVRALLPGGDGFPSGESLAIHQRIDEELWAAAPEQTSDIKAGLHLLEHGTLLHGQRMRFTALDAEAQRSYLTKLLTGRNEILLQVAMAFKQLAHLFYYGHPEVWKRIGYDGPYVQRAVPPDSHVAYGSLLRKLGGA